MDTSKIVGEKIKSLRESQSISMEELAERSGLAIEQVERIESNIDLPSLAPLIKIARVLGVRLGTFLDDQVEMVRLFVDKQVVLTTVSVSQTMPSKAVSTWNTMHWQVLRATVTWSRSLSISML
jgi:transcriptional regulator with XRE-family HTH domain